MVKIMKKNTIIKDIFSYLDIYVQLRSYSKKLSISCSSVAIKTDSNVKNVCKKKDETIKLQKGFPITAKI